MGLGYVSKQHQENMEKYMQRFVDEANTPDIVAVIVKVLSERLRYCTVEVKELPANVPVNTWEFTIRTNINDVDAWYIHRIPLDRMLSYNQVTRLDQVTLREELGWVVDGVAATFGRLLFAPDSLESKLDIIA